MDESLKGGLMMGVWFFIIAVILKVTPSPQSSLISLLFVFGSFVAAVLLVNYFDGRIISKKRSSKIEYPENWDEIRQVVLECDNYQCGNCGGNTNLHVHHIVPLSKGGGNNPGNLRTLCMECHKKLHPHMRE